MLPDLRLELEIVKRELGKNGLLCHDLWWFELLLLDVAQLPHDLHVEFLHYFEFGYYLFLVLLELVQYFDQPLVVDDQQFNFLLAFRYLGQYLKVVVYY